MANLILQDAITEARGLAQDKVAPYRVTDPDMLAFAIDGLRELTRLAPEIFIARGEFTCFAGEAIQSVPFNGVAKLVDVVRVKNGKALRPFDKPSLDAFDPNWMSATATAATGWAPLPGDPRRFYLDAPAPGGQVVELIYVVSPSGFAAGDDTGLPDTLVPVLADYIAGRALSINGDRITPKATELLSAFYGRFKAEPAAAPPAS